MFTLTMRIPILVADLFTLLLIMRVIRDASGSYNKALSGGLLWASSPLVFFFEAVNFAEIFPALLILTGVYAIHKSKTIGGSAFLALGALLRLAPLLFAWVYVVAFDRLREFKKVVEFVGVQAAFFATAFLYLIYRVGWPGAVDILGERPGVIIPEILTVIGPFLRTGLSYNPYDLALSFPAYLLLGYFITKPAVWRGRTFGAEVVALLAPYYALTDFFIPFLLWVIPCFLVNAVTTRFGSRRFALWTGVALLFYFFNGGSQLSQFGYTVFLIPNMNEPMARFSAALTDVVLLSVPREITRSLFTVVQILVLFWILRESTRSSAKKIRQQTREGQASADPSVQPQTTITLPHESSPVDPPSLYDS
jgi:hypothetical protein